MANAAVTISMTSATIDWHMKRRQRFAGQFRNRVWIWDCSRFLKLDHIGQQIHFQNAILSLHRPVQACSLKNVFELLRCSNMRLFTAHRNTCMWINYFLLWLCMHTMYDVIGQDAVCHRWWMMESKKKALFSFHVHQSQRFLFVSCTQTVFAGAAAHECSSTSSFSLTLSDAAWREHGV